MLNLFLVLSADVSKKKKKPTYDRSLTISLRSFELSLSVIRCPSMLVIQTLLEYLTHSCKTTRHFDAIIAPSLPVRVVLRVKFIIRSAFSSLVRTFCVVSLKGFGRLSNGRIYSLTSGEAKFCQIS